MRQRRFATQTGLARPTAFGNLVGRLPPIIRAEVGSPLEFNPLFRPRHSIEESLWARTQSDELRKSAIHQEPNAAASRPRVYLVAIETVVGTVLGPFL